MPRIISFGWTWPAIVAKEKTCTRRDWNKKFALSFEPDEICHAWDFSPRSGHGKWIADIKIKEVFHQNTFNMAEDDYKAEGFEFFDKHKHIIPQIKGSPFLNYMDDDDPCRRFFWNWKEEMKDLWVVKFKVMKVDENILANLLVDDKLGILWDTTSRIVPRTMVKGALNHDNKA